MTKTVDLTAVWTRSALDAYLRELRGGWAYILYESGEELLVTVLRDETAVFGCITSVHKTYSSMLEQAAQLTSVYD